MGSAKSNRVLSSTLSGEEEGSSFVGAEPPNWVCPFSEASTSETSGDEAAPAKRLEAPAAPKPSRKTKDYGQFPESLKGKRILLCTESFGPINGVSRTTLNLVIHLRRHGVRVSVAAPYNHTGNDTFIPPYVPHRDPTEDIDIRLRGYPLHFNPELSIVYPVRLSSLIARTFGWEHPPDLIYLASPASLGFQVMLQMRQWLKEKQIPIVCNFQTDLAGYCSILFPEPLATVANRTFGKVQSYLFRNSSIKRIYYPSRFVRRYLLTQGVPQDKMVRLGRGVDTQMFSPSRREEGFRQKLAPNGEIILICVSTLAGEKGFDFLAKTATLLDYKGLNFKLLIVGGNSQSSVEKSIKALFKPLIKKGKVIFAGSKTGVALAAAFASGDIFLHCSVTETFGLVVLESMASGVPVVARDEGGPSDTIVNGKTGFLVPPNNLQGFVTKVLHLAEDSELREKMGLMAREEACDATWEKINNKAAWGMADIIEEQQKLHGVNGTTNTNVTVPTIPLEDGGADDHEALRQKHHEQSIRFMRSDTVSALQTAWDNHMVEARLLWGQVIIVAFWFWMAIYVIFMELALWTKAAISRGDLDDSRTKKSVVKSGPAWTNGSYQGAELPVEGDARPD